MQAKLNTIDESISENKGSTMHGHEFDFNNKVVLDLEGVDEKRNINEMIYIDLNYIDNFTTDNNNLSDLCINLLNSFRSNINYKWILIINKKENHKMWSTTRSEME